MRLLMSLAWLTGAFAFADPVSSEAPVPSVNEVSEDAVSAPMSYQWAPEQSLLGVVVYYKRGGLLSAFAHDHVLVASRFDGEVAWDVDDVTRCKIAISFPLNALVVDPGSTRSIVGIDPEDTVSEGSKRQILDNAFAEKQLHASKYPKVRFESTSCASSEDGVVVTGTLAIRGVSVNLKVRADVSADRDGFSAKGRFDLRHKDLGFHPYSNGLLSNADPLRFVFNLNAVPSSSL